MPFLSRDKNKLLKGEFSWSRDQFFFNFGTGQRLCVHTPTPIQRALLLLSRGKDTNK